MAAANEDRADDSDAADTEAVKQEPGRKLEQRVGPIVGAGQIAEHHGGNSESVLQRIPRDGKVYTVEIVHQHAEAEEQGDAPSVSWDFQ